MPRYIRLNSVSRTPSQTHWTRLKDHADLRHKFATQVKESTRLVNHSTQTFEDPFAKNSYLHLKEVVSQKVPMDCINELTLDMLRPAAAQHLPISLLPESIRTSAGDADTLDDILLPLWTMWSSFSGLFLWPMPWLTRLRVLRRMFSTTPTGSSCYRQGMPVTAVVTRLVTYPSQSVKSLAQKEL
ncbi:hypothetical protein JTB14_024832 [Gonioctena quinquepunctata]|nr:hypothetical protein JTB14_024832 [Gonioctena quinquepunctata]